MTTRDRIHLLACPDCRRQLDVTALSPGVEVLCVCDRRLTVGEPQVVQIRGLACSRCGGAVGPGDTSCGYCRAALSSEDKLASTLCPACAHRIPNDSRHCKACGVELRATAVPALPAHSGCPRCDGRLRVHLAEDSEMFECADSAGCGGIWCTRATFDRLRRNAARLDISPGPEVEPPPMIPQGPSNGRAYLACPTCGDFMQRSQFRFGDRPTRIVIDVCKDHGIWFDRNELQAALTIVRRRSLDMDDTSSRTRSGLTSASDAVAQSAAVNVWSKNGLGDFGIGEMLVALVDSILGSIDF